MVKLRLDTFLRLLHIGGGEAAPDLCVRVCAGSLCLKCLFAGRVSLCVNPIPTIEGQPRFLSGRLCELALPPKSVFTASWVRGMQVRASTPKGEIW